MHPGDYVPDFKEFCALARQGNLIPVSREVLADFETPVSALAKIDRGPCAYLLESVEGGEKWGRYSFLGSGEPILLHGSDREVVLSGGRRRRRIPVKTDVLDCLRALMAEYRPVEVPGLPRFCGGAVGYLSYDVVRQFERLPSLRKDVLGLPLMCFLLTDTLLVFDNVAQTIRIVANAHVGDRDYKRAYAEAVRRIDGMIVRLRTGRRPSPRKLAPRRPLAFTSNMSKADFEKMVMQTKEYIKAGDIFQGVLSQRWQASMRARPFDLYRALRVINPSPYMYYLVFPEWSLLARRRRCLSAVRMTWVSCRRSAGLGGGAGPRGGAAPWGGGRLATARGAPGLHPGGRRHRRRFGSGG